MARSLRMYEVQGRYVEIGMPNQRSLLYANGMYKTDSYGGTYAHSVFHACQGEQIGAQGQWCLLPLGGAPCTAEVFLYQRDVSIRRGNIIQVYKL